MQSLKSNPIYSELAFTNVPPSDISTIANHYGLKLSKSKFVSRFADFPSASFCMFAMVYHLWRKYRKGMTIDEISVREEFKVWLGEELYKERFTGFTEETTQEFEEFLNIIYDFVDAAEKKYYAGFIGAIRRFREQRRSITSKKYQMIL